MNIKKNILNANILHLIILSICLEICIVPLLFYAFGQNILNYIPLYNLDLMLNPRTFDKSDITACYDNDGLNVIYLKCVQNCDVRSTY